MSDLANVAYTDTAAARYSVAYLQLQADVATVDYRTNSVVIPPTPPDTTAPTVTNVTPEGSALSPTGAIGFDVTDEGGNLTRSNVFAYYPATGRFEVVYFSGSVSGAWGARSAGFSPQYSGTREAITNGFRFSSVVRVGGWPANPVIIADPVDSAGNEAP